MTWVAAGVASASLTMSAVQYFNNKKNIKKDAANRPAYQIPPEIQQNLNQGQQAALQGLPEEQKQQYISNLQRGSAYALGQSSSRNGGLQGISAINEQQNQGYANMLSQDSAARMANQKELYGLRNNMADYKGQKFQLNNLNPYYEGIAARNANLGQLTQNSSNSVQMGAAGIGSYMNGRKHQQNSNPYVNSRQSDLMNQQTSQNENNYYKPNSSYGQSGTIVNDYTYNADSTT